MIAKTFGQTLREARKAAGYSQRELGARAVLDFTYLSKLENDRNAPPSARAMRRLAIVLNIKTDVLLSYSQSATYWKARAEKLAAELEQSNRGGEQMAYLGPATRAVINLMQDNFERDGINAPEDPLVQQICEYWGYGAVMDAAARLWAKKDPTGAHTTGPCRCTLQAAIDEVYPKGEE